MNRRLVFATLLVAMLATMAGCSTIFGGISDETLDQEQDYDDLREGETDVVIDLNAGSFIGSNEFRAVYHLNDTEELSMYRSNLVQDQALDIEAVRYWYPNGTEVMGSELDIDQGRSSTEVRVPNGNGTLAFTGGSGAKTFQLPAYVSGSYEVIVPERHRTDTFLFGNVNPGGYDREMVDDRERLVWDEVDSTLSIRFFHERDTTLFAGFVIIVTLIGGTGVAYYYRQVKQLQKRREEVGLDIDIEDDSD